MSLLPERTILGLTGPVDDRRLLALPAEGDLRSGQIEAALEARVQQVARHPAGRSHEAHALLVSIEAAADRLQAELALAGRGPLHPTAARRAAARLARVQEREAERRQVVAPVAVSLPGAGIGADDLTEFDRIALAVLVVSGGWNARSAKRLAAIAAEHGISVDDLGRVVDGLARFLSEGDGLRGALGEVGREARAAWHSPQRLGRIDAAEGRVEQLFGRIEEVLRDEIQSESLGSRARLIAVFALFAASWIGGLAWLYFGSDRGDPGAGEAIARELPQLPPAPPPEAAPSGPAATGANGEVIAPPPVLAAPAKFPRPPGFVPSATTAEVRAAAARSAEAIGSVETIARGLRTNRGRLEGQNLAELTSSLRGLAACWPALGDARDPALRALRDVAAATRGDESLVRLMQSMPGDPAADGGVAPRSQGRFGWQSAWANAFGAGALALLATDRALPSEVAAAARQEMRLRAIPIPRTDAGDPFAAAALASLSAEAVRLCEGLGLGALGSEDASRWIEAVVAAEREAGARLPAWIAAMDASLRAAGAIDVPGPLVDFLAFAIRSTDFSGRSRESDRTRDALASWMLDAKIPPSRIWVFTSLLDADLGIPWFGPDLIAATNATADARAALAERMLAAFPEATRTGAGEAVLVEAAALDAWRKAVDAVRALDDRDPALRARNIAAMLALARAAREFERGDEGAAQGAVAEAAALMRRSLDEWIASPTGERAGLPASGVVDGEWAGEWTRAGDRARRIELARSLGQRPASGDLGPADAAAAARAALRTTDPEVRAAITTVLVDRYASGPQVLAALIDALGEGSTRSDSAEFLSVMVGARLGGQRWQGEARQRLIERLMVLEDRPEHMLDEACAEIVRGAGRLARAYGSSDALASIPENANLVPASAAADALAGAVDAMAAESARRFLAATFPAPPDEIERMRGVRRTLARSATQRIAAETPALVDHAAALVVARQPALRSSLEEALAANRRLRSAASSASGQACVDLRALLEVLGRGLAPAPTRRDA